MLRVSAVKKRDGFTLQAQLEAPTPGVVALFGRSGCGKTTLVNLISGLLAPDEGRIQLDDTVLADTRAGISVPVEERRIGYVFQDARLFPHFSVLGNLRYGLKRSARRDRGRSERDGLDEVVALLGLAHLLDRRPHQLSGGERQRVGLGRALLSRPRLLLLDEPLASLDAARRQEVLPYLEALRDHLAIPMVYVSHQFEEVVRLATHVVLMEAGRVVAHGSLGEVSLRPELRAIVGKDAVGSVLDGVVTRVEPAQGMADVRVGDGSLYVSLTGVPIGARVRVQLLARDVILATRKPEGLSVRNELRGLISQLSADDADSVLVEVDIGGATLLSRITREASRALHLAPGMQVWALVKAVSTHGHVFRAEAAPHPTFQPETGRPSAPDR